MARKESITKETILQAAFEMAREEGIEQVTARKLAARAGCSTQPIFRAYKNMEELWEELFRRTTAYYEAYYQAFPKKYPTPFVNLGMAYIRFAQEHKHLFQMLFLSEKRFGKTLYDLINGQTGEVGKEIAQAVRAGCQEPGSLFMKMWIFIHGAASMALTGDFDLSMEDTVKLLEDSCQAFLSRK